MHWIKWKEHALNDLADIIDYIEQFNPTASRKLQEQIVYAVDNLPNHPCLYRSGRVLGTREVIVHPNYLVIYTRDQ